MSEDNAEVGVEKLGRNLELRHGTAHGDGEENYVTRRSIRADIGVLLVKTSKNCFSGWQVYCSTLEIRKLNPKISHFYFHAPLKRF